MIRVIDNFLPTVDQCREMALAQEPQSLGAGEMTFHGIIRELPPLSAATMLCMQYAPALQPTLSFFRKSPYGQQEPNFIHSDCEMGDWTAILYLNPRPAKGDGTDFWKRGAAVGSKIPGDLIEEGRTRDGWERKQHVAAKYNRLLIFSSWLFHSRALFENYGAGDDARLIQVVFGTGSLAEAFPQQEAA